MQGTYVKSHLSPEKGPASISELNLRSTSILELQKQVSSKFKSPVSFLNMLPLDSTQAIKISKNFAWFLRADGTP